MLPPPARPVSPNARSATSTTSSSGRGAAASVSAASDSSFSSDSFVAFSTPSSTTDPTTFLVPSRTGTDTTKKPRPEYGQGWMSTSPRSPPPAAAFLLPLGNTTPSPRRAPASVPRVHAPLILPGCNTINNDGYPRLQTASADAPNTYTAHTHAPLFPPRHHTRSPSVPSRLPSDDARRVSDSRYAAEALQHLTPGEAFERAGAGGGATMFSPSDSSSREHDRAAALVRGGSNAGSSSNASAPSPTTGFPRTPTEHAYAPLHSPAGRRSQPETHGYTHTDIGERRNVYIPALNAVVTEDDLRQAGQMFGRVVSVKVQRAGTFTPDVFDMLPDGANNRSGATRSYAFVMFESPASADKFMRALQDRDIGCMYGKETSHLRQKVLEDPHSSNLYVAEIPLTVTEEDMRSLFHPGVICSLRFLTDDKGNRRGTAMVRLQSRAQAEEAIQRLDLSVVMPGCTKALQVRIADSEHQKQYKRVNMAPRTPTTPTDPHRSLPSSPLSPFVRIDHPASASASASSSPLRHSVAVLPGSTSGDDETTQLVERINALQAELARRKQEARQFRTLPPAPATPTRGRRMSTMSLDHHLRRPLELTAPESFDNDDFDFDSSLLLAKSPHRGLSAAATAPTPLPSPTRYETTPTYSLLPPPSRTSVPTSRITAHRGRLPRMTSSPELFLDHLHL